MNLIIFMVLILFGTVKGVIFMCPMLCNCNDISVCVSCEYYYLIRFRQLLEQEHKNNVKSLEKEEKKCYNDTNKD